MGDRTIRQRIYIAAGELLFLAKLNYARLHTLGHIFLLALSWVGRPNLGGKVKHKGRCWILVQGVMHPVWTLSCPINHERKEVHTNDFDLVMTPEELWQSFRSGWRFYYGYWFHIWRRQFACGERIMRPAQHICRVWHWPFKVFKTSPHYHNLNAIVETDYTYCRLCGEVSERNTRYVKASKIHP